MASVLNSKAKYYRSEIRDVDNQATEHILESEADVFIKELSSKQLRTSTSLEEQLSQKKEFQSSHSYQPLTEQTSGALSYNDFKNLTTDNSKNAVENLVSSDQSPSILKNVSRHMRELALAVKPNSTETKLLEFAIACNAVKPMQPDHRPADHPINHLHDYESQLFGHLNETSDPERAAKTVLRKRKQLLEAMCEPIVIKSKPKAVRGTSLWDVVEPAPPDKERLCKKVYTCQKEKLFTIRNGEIVSLEHSIKDSNFVEEKQHIVRSSSKDSTENEISSHLSVEEIKNLPKFQNYQKGIPSETLYLKNLSSHMKEVDLSTLFGEFQRSDKPRIVYNLMKSGKMRGQAFVHFHCVETAAEALEKLNGRIVHGKPLIIQFSLAKR